jgi:hypothetical protein
MAEFPSNDGGEITFPEHDITKDRLKQIDSLNSWNFLSNMNLIRVKGIDKSIEKARI